MKQDTGIVDIHGRQRKIYVSKNGYGVIANVGGRRGKTLYMHRIIAELAIGRPLKPTEVVHHVDGDRSNNDRTNLVICDSDSYHHLLHRRQRAYKETGDPSSILCEVCGKYGAEKERSNREGRGWHLECKREYERASYARRRSDGKLR